MAERIPQSVAYLVVFRAFLASDGKTPATGKTIAITISKNGGAFGNPNAGATNATEITSGFYKFTLDTTDTGTLGPVAWRGAEGTINDAGDVKTVANAFNAGFTGVPAAAAEASGGLATLSAAQASNGTINANVHRWLTGTPNALSSGRVDVLVGAVTAGVIAAASFAANALDAVWSTAARVLTAATNITSTGGTTVPQTGDSFARIGAPAGASVSADIAAAKTVVDAIKVVTDKFVFTVANKVDSTIQLASDFAQGAADLVWSTAARVLTAGTNIVLAKGVGVTGFNDPTAATTASAVRTELATELGRIDVAVSTRLATAGYTAPPTAAAVADQVWEEILADHSGTVGSTAAALNAAGAAGDPWSTAIPGAYGAGTAGNIVGNALDAAISSRSSHTASDVWAVVTRRLSDGTNIVLAKGVGVTGFNDPTAAVTASAVRTELATELGRVDVAISTRLATAGYTVAPTAAAISDAVWEEAIADHSGTVGSTAAALNAAGAAGDPWSTPIPGAYIAGTAGFIIGNRLDAAVTTRAAVADVLTQALAALDTTIPDSIPADGALPSVRQALYMGNQFMFEKSIVGTTVTVKKADGTTTLFTLTLNSASSPTASTRTT